MNQMQKGACSPAIPHCLNESSSSGTTLPFTCFLQPLVGSPACEWLARDLPAATAHTMFHPSCSLPDLSLMFLDLTATNAQGIKPIQALNWPKKPQASLDRAEVADLSGIRTFDIPSGLPCQRGAELFNCSLLTPCLNSEKEMLTFRPNSASWLGSKLCQHRRALKIELWLQAAQMHVLIIPCTAR